MNSSNEEVLRNLTQLAANDRLEMFLILPEATNLLLFVAGVYGMYQGIQVLLNYTGGIVVMTNAEPRFDPSSLQMVFLSPHEYKVVGT